MAFRDFRYPEVRREFGLSLAEVDLFGDVPPLALTAEFSERMQSGVDLALAVNTEKARSEFIIAPPCWNSAGCSTGASACSRGSNSTSMTSAG